jgi:hypothetical protein
MKLKLLIAGCLTMGLAVSACGDTGDDAEAPSPVASADMALNVDLLGSTDVVGFKFKATRVHCSGSHQGDPVSGAEVFTGEQSLEEGYLPGGNSTFENGPYDAQSEHHFSDQLFTVPVGCYDVQAEPIRANQQRSEDCAIATLHKKYVKADHFNEFHLISQCRGTARTTLDVIASLNHPPEIELDIQKFMCSGAGVTVCATASDVDDDPLRFYWNRKDPACYIPQSLGRATVDPQNGEATHCVTIPSRLAESLSYEVVVKDLAWDSQLNKLVPIEELLPEQDSQGLGFDADESRASLHFDTHAVGECVAAPMAFIGVTLGAGVQWKYGKLVTNNYRGMRSGQSKQLAKNAIDYVNPNAIGDPDPRILVVRDTANSEDKLEGKYIKQQLEAAGFNHVTLISDPFWGLKLHDTIGFKIVWFVNPGHPINNDKSYDTLRHFRKRGGGVIVSGDDANQNVGLTAPRSMSNFSFLSYLSNNGTNTCGKRTDNNQGKNYLVKLEPNTPLTQGMSDHDFPYGNDIDRNHVLNQGETVGAYTEGLDLYYKKTCLGAKFPVMTTVPADQSL